MVMKIWSSIFLFKSFKELQKIKVMQRVYQESYIRYNKKKAFDYLKSIIDCIFHSDQGKPFLR